MKDLAIYNWHDGKPFTVEYDPNDPCILCGLPVTAASMGGTSICPSCDCGRYRDGSRIDCIPGTEIHKSRARRIYDLMILEYEAHSAHTLQLPLPAWPGHGLD